MSTTFRGGRLPAQPARPHLRLTPYLEPTSTPLPKRPASADWLGRVPEWPMYGNDRYGDCTFASPGHMIQAWTTYGQATTVTIGEDAVLAGYSALTGFTPDDPSTDQGAYIQDVMGYWRKTGIGGHKILAYAAVDVRNLDEIEMALDLFGAVNVGINLPESALDQFDAGQPWDVVRGSRNAGGHCVPVGRYTDAGTTGDSLACVTWAKVQPLTQAFWEHYVDEAWIAITEDWVNANGTNPLGLNLYNLGQDLQALTGTPNPIPAPQPPAPPVPTPPTPPAPPADVDQQLAAALTGLDTAAAAWRTEHGL